MPTAAEKRWMAQIVDMGCICCRIRGFGYVPTGVHHMIDKGGRRMGHLFTLPLCDPGHHKGASRDSGEISRHPNKAAFERRYGTEARLLEITRSIVADNEGFK